MRVPLASNGLTEEQIQAGIAVLQSGRLTMGMAVTDFENKMARYLGRRHFVMMNSGSSANIAMIEGLIRPTSGVPLLKPGDGVLVPAIAWPTTVWPIVQLGLVPIFVDIDPETLGLSLDHAEALLELRGLDVRALMPIHPLGVTLSNEQLARFAEKHSLLLLGDVCESLGSFDDSGHAGNSSFASSFSFYFSHHITTMEGGGVSTDDDNFAEDLRSIRSHGWSRDRHGTSQFVSTGTVGDQKFVFVSSGFNLRPMEIQAAMGLVELPSLGFYVQRRREIAESVKAALSGSRLTVIDGAEAQGFEPAANSWMHIPLRILGEQSKSARDHIMNFLEARGIETRPVLTGNFVRQPASRLFLETHRILDDFSAADEVSGSSFLIGCHHSFADTQLEYLVESLKLGLSQTN